MATENDLLRIVLAVLAVIVLVPILMMLFMMPMMGMGGGHMADGGMWGTTGGTWMWALMWLVPLAVVVGIGYLVYQLVRRSAEGAADPAIEELRIAYARGDLTEEEFEERRDRLRRE